MKCNYEDRTRFYLPRRTYTILRLDGCRFHTYTKGLKKPFDNGLSEDIDDAILAMLPEIQGAVFAYTQSDEISILLTDFATPQTDAWFDGNIQKICSVASSIMTAEFNRLRWIRAIDTCGLKNDLDDPCSTVDAGNFDNISKKTVAYFDCRTFTIPDRVEVMNYFRWRQQDCVRNSVSMVAQANFSHKELHGKSQSDMHEMLHKKGINWATDFTDGEKNGRIISRELYMTHTDKDTLNKMFENFCDNAQHDLKNVPIPVQRTRWTSTGAWVFTKDEGKLLKMIPEYE